MLEKLMDYIAEEEEEAIEDHSNHDTCSSFLPFGLPQHVSHAPNDRPRQSLQSNRPCCRLPSSQRYLPCHYFDYIGGSSTGA